MPPCASISSSPGPQPASRAFIGAEILDPRADDEALAAPAALAPRAPARPARIEGSRARSGSAGAGRAAVASTLRSCKPASAAWSVRGMGVAVRVSVCTPVPSVRSAFFCLHPEPLLLVHDQQPELLEAHALARERLRADHDADARRPRARRAPRAPRRAGSGATGPPTRTPRPAKRRSNVCICWRASTVVGGDDRDLPAAERRHRRGADRDLRLAEADVAADQPVHRPARGEVRLDRRDGVLLVPGRREREPGHEPRVSRALAAASSGRTPPPARAPARPAARAVSSMSRSISARRFGQASPFSRSSAMPPGSAP